jgi:hypothetical protein
MFSRETPWFWTLTEWMRSRQLATANRNPEDWSEIIFDLGNSEINSLRRFRHDEVGLIEFKK